ncbi:MAG: hypothetical protein PVS3B3_13870 [Ktedonobacteraceae bacterium]
MTTNITAFKVRSIDLTFPLRFDFGYWISEQPYSPGKRDCLQDKNEVQANLAKNTWKLSFICDQEISGIIEDDKLIAKEIDCRGEGSNTAYGDIILPLFKDFKGNLKAVVAWEDGTMYRVTIEGGIATEEEID